MTGGRFDLGDYVDVDERIRRFYEKYPDGRIATLGIPQITEIDGKRFIVAQAAAYRTPDDAQPCVGTAAEPFPGQTSYTKDSEMMNAETSAWGRAIVAAGILAKGEGVASKNEVRNRRGSEPSGNENASTSGHQYASRANSGAPPPLPDPEQDEMCCPRCGKSSALRPVGRPKFCAKANGGCGAPKDGDAWALISRAEWERTH